MFVIDIFSVVGDMFIENKKSYFICVLQKEKQEKSSWPRDAYDNFVNFQMIKTRKFQIDDSNKKIFKWSNETPN